MASKYLLDSDILIDILEYGVSPPVDITINCFTSSLTVFEIAVGTNDFGLGLQKFLDDAGINILPFSDSAAFEAGKMYTVLSEKGCVLGKWDVCIASIAVENNLILVTNNIKHFSRIKELKLFGY